MNPKETGLSALRGTYGAMPLRAKALQELRELPNAPKFFREHLLTRFSRDAQERKELAEYLRELRQDDPAYARIMWTGAKARSAENDEDKPANLQFAGVDGGYWWYLRILRRILQQVRHERKRARASVAADATEAERWGWTEPVRAGFVNAQIEAQEWYDSFKEMNDAC